MLSIKFFSLLFICLNLFIGFNNYKPNVEHNIICNDNSSLISINNNNDDYRIIKSSKKNIESMCNHDYVYSRIVWNDHTANAIYVCSKDSTHIETYPCIIKEEISKTPTCSSKGEIKYTATYDGHSSFLIEELEINPDNHNIEHFLGTEPTCQHGGYEDYDYCTYCKTKFNYVELPIGEHIRYDHPYYSWNDEGECLGYYICDYCCKTIISEKATCTIDIIQELSCEDDELKTFTFTFENPLFETQVFENVKTKDKLGHDWDVTIYWDEDYNAKAIFVCKNDPSHIEEHDCKVNLRTFGTLSCVETTTYVYYAHYEQYNDTIKFEIPNKNYRPSCFSNSVASLLPILLSSMIILLFKKKH